MDLALVKHKETTMQVKHPATGADIGVAITIMSVRDPRMKSLLKFYADEELTRQRKNKSDKADDVEKRARRMWFKAIISWEWSGDATFHGDKPELTEANFLNIVEEIPWFGTQLDEFITEERNFLPH